MHQTMDNSPNEHHMFKKNKAMIKAMATNQYLQGNILCFESGKVIDPDPIVMMGRRTLRIVKFFI